MPLTVSRRLRVALAVALLTCLGLTGAHGALATTRDPNVITRSGTTLMLHGHAYRFTGVNAFQIGTYWNVNAGCGQQLSDAQLDAFFTGLRPDSVVRFWAFQAQGVNTHTHRIDYTGLDRVFRAAERHHQRLLPVLGSQDGTCDDGHWKDAAWYSGAYIRAFNDDHRGLNVIPFSSWVSQTVTRYKSSPALGMWEAVNEPEPTNCATGIRGNACYGHTTCPPSGAANLRAFFDAFGSRIKRLDPAHLVVSGVIGSGQCGASGPEYSKVHASPYIDVATYHDYGEDTTPLPGDQWNGMRLRIQQAAALGKPLITEEVGILSSPNGALGCVSPVVRAGLLHNKLAAQLAAGSRGFLAWNYSPSARPGCEHDIAANDPTMTVLRQQPL